MYYSDMYLYQTQYKPFSCGDHFRDEEKSVLWLHSLHHHQGREDVVYRMRTTGSYADPLDRQLQERVNITNFKGPILMNRRNEMGGVRVDRMRYRRWGGN